MLKYGLLMQDIKNIILELEIDDYYKGPEADMDGYDGEILIFTSNFKNTKLYIKIRLEKNKIVICISIHEDGIY